MAIDRVIRFPDPANVPTPELLLAVAEDYLGSVSVGEGKSVVTKCGGSSFLLTVTLPGSSSCAFRRAFPAVFAARAGAEFQQQSRWFEINSCGLLRTLAVDPEGWCPWVDVMTRASADEFTLAVASGYAQIVARYWGGTLEAGE